MSCGDDRVVPAGEPPALAGWRVDRSRPILTPHGCAGGSVWTDRQIAVLLIQERVEALVVSWGQSKHAEQCAIASSRVLEATMNQRCQIIARQLVRLERLMNDGPEVLTCNQPIPQSIGSARTPFEASCRRH